MRFNPKADISGGRATGSSGGGGGFGGGGGLGGIPIPGGLGIKGTIVVVILYFILQMCTSGSLPGSGLPGVPGGSDNNAADTDNSDYADCKTGEDANKSRACERKAIMLSLEKFWSSKFEGQQFPAPTLHTFSGQTSTGCGAANAGMGPFYCPTDQNIYEDPSFYTTVLKQIGGSDAPFVEPYVLGHEYGHHIQNITGEMKKVRSQQGADSDAVKLELEADCYAGLWTHAATTTTDSNGEPIFAEISDQDIKDAIKAAWAVGDDHIQETTQGRIDEGSFTHGTSEQRMDWFKKGFASTSVETCTAIWG